MVSKTLRWVHANSLALLLVVATFIILGLPLLRYGVSGTFFYSLDPDIVYVTNAILYAKAGVVIYADHPGTPTILLLYYAFLPLRLFAKYYFHQSFTQWSFANFSFLLYYSRVFQLILYCSAVFVFLQVIRRTFKPVFITLFAWLTFFCMMGVDRSISVVPENLSIFLTAVWLFFFTKFLSRRSYFWNTILVVVSAFAVANKYTSIFILIPALFLPVFITKLTVKQKTSRFVINAFTAAATFYLGILPARGRLTYMFSWVKELFYHADVHGTGAASIFDWKSYSISVYALINGAPIAFAIICSTLILAIYLVIRKRLKLTDPVIVLTFTTFVGIAVFAKYPLIHYFAVSFVVLIFCLSYFLSKTRSVLTILMLLILILPFVRILHIYSNGEVSRFEPNLTHLQKFVYANPAKSNVLWGYGVENEYAELYSWTNTWSGNLFAEQFKAKPVLILSYDMKSINSLGEPDSKSGIFDVCWDKAYLPKETEAKFLETFKNRKLKAVPIPGEDSIYEISSSHCTN